ncbi:MAG: hypothetical protein LC739_05555, partial [Actinobacteria bacterium]|nr:hypothetical protein [Actinomycetota bacterium]
MTEGAGFWKSWPVLLLAGPVIWISHFWVVYLWAEAACVPPWDSAVEFVTVAATVVAIGAILGFGISASRSYTAADDDGDHRRLLYLYGVLLAGLSVVATLFVGLPAL